MSIEMSINYKRNEDKIIREIQEYVDKTYSQHYAGSNNRDVVDDWEDVGIAKEAFQSNIIKYAKRFGKKDGDNPKDIMKIIHYSIFLLNELQQNDGSQMINMDDETFTITLSGHDDEYSDHAMNEMNEVMDSLTITLNNDEGETNG
jgi:hypothetical protein